MAPRSEEPELIIRVISFELTQHIRLLYINVTDRQTDGRLTFIGIPRFAVRASRGKNAVGQMRVVDNKNHKSTLHTA